MLSLRGCIYTQPKYRFQQTADKKKYSLKKQGKKNNSIENKLKKDIQNMKKKKKILKLGNRVTSNWAGRFRDQSFALINNN